MNTAIRSITSKYFPARQVSQTRIGSIGDAHGSRNWIELSKRMERSCDLMVGLGDLADRGNNNLEVWNRAQQLHMTGRYTQIMGNHELAFATGMFGKEESMVRWLNNGGDKTLEEFRVAPWRKAVSWFLGFTPREQSLLQSHAYWIAENTRLYRTDDFGALYVHAGIPVDENGHCALKYGGETGLRCLDLAQDHLKEAFSKGNMSHKVFGFLEGSEDSFLWNKTWFTTVIEKDTAQKLLDDLGVKMIVFGHLHKSGVTDLDHKIFCIGGRIHKGDASFLVNTARAVEIESLAGQRTVIEKP
jgi:predicted phosphodiesterase